MSTEAARQYSWADDKTNSIPITASRMDTEFDAIITKLNQKCVIKATAPTSPIAGMLWIDSTNKLLKQYRNSEWVVMGAVHVAATGDVMATPQEGDLWFDTTLHTLNMYNGSAWITLLSNINGLTEKESFVDADQFVIADSEASNAHKKILKSTMFSATAAEGKAPLMGASGYMPDDSVDTTALKTATGEVNGGGGAYATLALPGGEYGFYPQVKMASTDSQEWTIGICGRATSTYTGFTSYATKIGVYSSDADVIYAQQRYVTASGIDLWVFLLLEKATKNIVASWQAPDHPAYGNGGDFSKMPHPFFDYDENKHEIVLLDKSTCNQLKQESRQTGKSILTLINEEYKPDMSKAEVYAPLHSGQFINEAPVMVKSIPDYITVRQLIKLSQQDKDEKENKRQQAKQKAQRDKSKMEQDKQSAIMKLKGLGLNEDEILALRG